MKMDTPSSEQGNREMFLSLVSQHLNRLYRFVRHELAYFQAVGDLIPGELTAEDVVDETLIRAYREFVKDPARLNIRGRLIRLAREQLEAEVKRLKSERYRAVHIEKDIPETPPTQKVSTLGDEILDFYQPDEDLKIEDIIPDIEIPTPERVPEMKELRQCVNAALTGMPEEWRRALLCHVEGLNGAELAEAVGMPESEIERVLQDVREHLRNRLIELGCTLK